mgnify:CR=1 FL=1
MMENKSDKGGFWRRQSFLLPPLTAAVVFAVPADGFFQSIRRGHGEHFAVGTEFLQLCGAFAWGKKAQKNPWRSPRQVLLH